MLSSSRRALDAVAHGDRFTGGGIVGLPVALRAPRRGLAARRATAYIEMFQGTPVLMQLFLVFFGANLFGN